MRHIIYFLYFLLVAFQHAKAQRSLIDEGYGLFNSSPSSINSIIHPQESISTTRLKGGFPIIAQTLFFQGKLNSLKITPEIKGTYCQANNGAIIMPEIDFEANTLFSWVGPNEFNSQDWSLNNLEHGLYELTIKNYLSQRKLIFEVPKIPTYEGLEICSISTDDDNNGYRIWFSDNGVYNGAYYEVFREEGQTGNYTLIGQVPSGTKSFLDADVDITSNSYNYKVRFQDACGFYAEYSPVHKTLFLQASLGIDESQINLHWSPYQGRNITSYMIYRSINENPFELIKTLPFGVESYTDNDAITSKNTYAYYIEIQVEKCSEENESYSIIKSNTNRVVSNYLLDDDLDGVPNIDDLCPNSAPGDLVDVFGCKFYTMPSDSYQIKSVSATCPGVPNGSITVNFKYSEYTYYYNLNDGAKSAINENQLTINNLSAGIHKICVYVDGYSEYQQCFSINIAEPPALGASASVDRSARLVTLNLSGSDKYYITHNGTTTTTDKQQVTIALRSGSNTLEVNTDLGCQGTFFEEVFVSEEVILYPNPTQGMIQVYVAGVDQSVSAVLRDLSGNTSIQQEMSVPQNRVIELDLTQLPTGVYVLMLSGETVRTTEKIIKE